MLQRVLKRGRITTSACLQHTNFRSLAVRTAYHCIDISSLPSTTRNMSASFLSSTSSDAVNLLDMASTVLASAVSASESIRAFAQPNGESEEDQKNARLKADGSFVTDADFVAQRIITLAVQKVNHAVRILGEESPEGVAKVDDDNLQCNVDQQTYERCREEVYLRFQNRPLNGIPPRGDFGSSLPLASSNSDAGGNTFDISFALSENEKAEVLVDASRVCVIIDPLDGTSSYAKGEYDAVSVLISVNLDFQPYFGIICKPFGCEGVPSILSTKCMAVYGGPLLGAGYIAGGKALKAFVAPHEGVPKEDLPRAVISSSRSKGIVEDVCRHLGSLGLLHPDPMHISGAGEKSLRLVLRQQNEALWFFPREGTSLWDIAASDAILRAIGGKVTDKFGNQLDYSKSRDEAENSEGVIACSSEKLHAECMQIFQEKNWED